MLNNTEINVRSENRRVSNIRDQMKNYLTKKHQFGQFLGSAMGGRPINTKLKRELAATMRKDPQMHN